MNPASKEKSATIFLFTKCRTCIQLRRRLDIADYQCVWCMNEHNYRERSLRQAEAKAARDIRIRNKQRIIMGVFIFLTVIFIILRRIS